MQTDTDRLDLLFAARHPAVAAITPDEAYAAELAVRVARGRGLPVWTWNVIDGVRDHDHPDRLHADTENPAGGLFWLTNHAASEPGKGGRSGVQLICDLGPHLGDARTARALRRLIEHNRACGSVAVLIDHAPPANEFVRSLATPFEVSYPDEDEIESIVRRTLREVHAQTPIEIDMTQGQFKTILKNLGGLSRTQVAQVVRDVVADDLRFDEADLNHALANKRRMLGDSGALEFVESPASLDDVGGLGALKAWLAQRSQSFSERAEEYGLRPPRGVLLLGVQGAGKSLCAKAIATAWSRPLLRLDPGSLYDRYVGESERRLRDALSRAEAMAPIVLWIDEIEKGFASAASQSTDGGLSQRMFGTLLTWMQDHEAPVFLVATANNIDALPPELLRKGRFDEIFFVDLPSEEARRAIARVHLAKRRRDPGLFDLARIAQATEGFSGAEIEQAIISSMHEAMAQGREPTTESIVAAAEASPPLSVTMREKIEALRDWARERCVPAG